MNGRRLTYANVVATLALFAALGGSSYAAISITGKQVRDGSLSGRDVRNATLTSQDVHDQSLLARDFKAGQLPAGPQGPKGDAGPQGPVGPVGAPGLPGSARAFARFDPEGRVEAGKGLSVPGGGDGIYCVMPAAGSGIEPDTSVAVVTTTAAQPSFATVSHPPSGCEGWLVNTFEFQTVNGTPSVSNAGHGFTIAVM